MTDSVAVPERRIELMRTTAIHIWELSLLFTAFLCLPRLFRLACFCFISDDDRGPMLLMMMMIGPHPLVAPLKPRTQHGAEEVVVYRV